jgi:antirestriction protein ArdC
MQNNQLSSRMFNETIRYILEFVHHDYFFLKEPQRVGNSRIQRSATNIPFRDISRKKISRCDSLMGRMTGLPAIWTNNSTAFYHPKFDRIYMPPYETYPSAEFYYHVLFHELIHSTGSPKRLNRFDYAYTVDLTTPTHSWEEIIAELGSAFLSRIGGIHRSTIGFTTLYLALMLKSWPRRSEHVLVINQAAESARVAVNYMLSPRRRT